MTVDLVLCDDWELRGNGSGNMEAIQFRTLRELLTVYEEFELTASINAEVMQQLQHRENGARHRQLRALADRWDELVIETVERGHDVQLHIHPQWHDARYGSDGWTLHSRWSIADHPRADVERMVADCAGYLRSLIGPARPGYEVVAFRSGAWCAAPAPDLFPVLEANGIEVDVSLVSGLVYDFPELQLDYRALEEDFCPFTPDYADARRLGPRRPGAIVCCPTHSFYITRWQDRRERHARRIRRLLAGERYEWRYRAPNETPVPGAGDASGASQQAWGASRVTPPDNYCISDLSNLSASRMDFMLEDIRARFRTARKLGKAGPRVPVVLENHTKDIGDFTAIRDFARKLSESRDLEVISLTELARRIRDGRYQIQARP